MTLAARAATRTFAFFVLHDPTLTPLFTYVSLLNASPPTNARRAPCRSRCAARSSFGADGQVDDRRLFSGDQRAVERRGGRGGAPRHAAWPTSSARSTRRCASTSRSTRPRAADRTTIERAWLDTVAAASSAAPTRCKCSCRTTAARDRVVAMPVTMPAQADGPLTLLVTDAPTLHAARAARPARRASRRRWPDCVARVSNTRRNNRLYVRLIDAAPGHGARRRHAAVAARVGAVGAAGRSPRVARARQQDGRRRVGAADSTWPSAAPAN